MVQGGFLQLRRGQPDECEQSLISDTQYLAGVNLDKNHYFFVLPTSDGRS